MINRVEQLMNDDTHLFSLGVAKRLVDYSEKIIAFLKTFELDQLAQYTGAAHKASNNKFGYVDTETMEEEELRLLFALKTILTMIPQKDHFIAVANYLYPLGVEKANSLAYHSELKYLDDICYR